jgi:hypothetical protein
LGPESESVQPVRRLPPQLRPEPPGSELGPESESLQPWKASAGSAAMSPNAPAVTVAPATVAKNERRLSLRVGFIGDLPLRQTDPSADPSMICRFA